MSQNTVTTEQVHELIEQLAAMTAAASITPEIVANIFEKMRQLNDYERSKVIAIAEEYIEEIQNTGVPANKVSLGAGTGISADNAEAAFRELAQVLRLFIEDASGDTCFTDASGHIVFRLSSNGAEAKQFRVLNSSGELIGTIDSAFLSAVLKSSDIIDNLTSSAINKPLSAKQGSVLKGLINELMSSLSSLSMFIDDESGNTCFVDNSGDIVFRLSTNGVDMRKLNILNSDGSLVGTIDKDFFDYITSSEGLQSIAENILVDDSGNTYFADERGNVALKIASDGSIDFKALGDNLKRAVKEEFDDGGIKKIRCWGDSLTMGAGANNTYNKNKVVSALVSMGYTDVFTSVSNIGYPEMIQLLLGNMDYEVINHGVGGETINTIAARQGAYNAMTPQDVTIPATKTPVLLGNDKLLSTFYYLEGQTITYYSVKPLLQGTDNSVNPITIEGIEGTLSVTYDSGYTNVKYYFTRSEVGRETVIPQHSPIIMKGSALSPNAHASIIWCWQNGGFYNLTELKKKLHQYIEKLNTSYYVIVGLHTGDAVSREEQERELEREFGDRFFNWRRYVSTNALYDFGITPTTDEDLTQEQIDHNVKSDTYQMSIGALPSSLWRRVYGVNGASSNDYIHLNSAGYMILGYKLVERLKLLGAL